MSTLKIETPRAFKPLLPPARYKGAYGGRASGKSHFFAELGIERALADGARIVCIREVQKTLKESVRQLLVDKIEALDVRANFDPLRDEIRGENGSLFTFMGMNDASAENIKSLEGYDIAWVEEAHTLSQRSLKILRPTIRKPGSELWFSWNPRHKSDAVDEFLRSAKRPKDSVVIQVNCNDNPWFPEALRKEMQEDYERDEEEAKHVWGGAYEPAPQGSYYGLEIAKMEAEGRITELLVDPTLPVHTCWDLGTGGNMVTWFFQLHMGQFRWVDFHEYEVSGLPHAASILRQKQADRGFTYGTHLWPHDGNATETGSGEVRKDTFRKLGFTATVLDRSGLANGIEAVRGVLAMSYFDRDRCEKGLEHLRGYRRKFDKVHDRFIEEPDKNGHDHAADALRYGAMGKDKVSNDPQTTGWSKDVMNFQLNVA